MPATTSARVKVRRTVTISWRSLRMQGARRYIASGHFTSDETRKHALGNLLTVLSVLSNSVEVASSYAALCLLNDNSTLSQLPPFVTASHDCVRLSLPQLDSFIKSQVLTSRLRRDPCSGDFVRCVMHVLSSVSLHPPSRNS